MKKALLLALSIFAVFNVNAQEAILKEGGKRINGTASGQVLKWTGTTWVPGTDNAGSADSTWGKGNYASPTYSGKRIVDNVFRRAIVSLFTSDTTGVLNLKESKKTENLGGAIVVNGSSNGDSVNVYMRLKSSDTETPDFIIGGINSGVISAAGKNNSWYFGHNIYPGGTRIDTSKSATFQFFESNFTNGLPILGNVASAEMHWGFTPKWNPSNAQSRVISTALDHRGRVNNFGVQGDLFYIERFGRPFGFRSWDTETWLKADFYAGTFDFGDTISVRMPHNNVGGYWQRNAANGAYVRMLMLDNLDRILLGGAGPGSRVAAYNHLEVTNSGLISNENNDITIGNSSFPTRLTVESNDGATLTLKKTGNSHSVTHGLFNSQYYIMNTATSEAPFRMDVNLPDYAFWLRANGLGLGTPSPQAKIHLTSTGGATAKMIALDNTTGTSYIYRTNATPESAITASQGDLALSNTGELYGKVSGTNTNTGWGKFLNLNDGNSASIGQVLKWNGSAWGSSNDNSGSADSTWARGSYSSPVYSPKNLSSYVFRKGKTSIFTDDTTASLNLKPRYLRGWTEKIVAPDRRIFWGNPAYADGSAIDVQIIDINPMKANHYSGWNFGRWRDQIFTDSLTNLANGRAGNSIRNIGFNMEGDNAAMPKWYYSTEQHYTFPGNPKEFWEHHVEVFDTLNRQNRPFNLNGSYKGDIYGAGFRVTDFYIGDPRTSDYRFRMLNGVSTFYNALGVGGVVTPFSNLDVDGDANIHKSGGAALYLSDENFQNASFYNKAPGLKAIYNAGQGVTSDLGLYSYNGNRLLVAIAAANGNFGIGNSDPTDKLHVTGSARITGAIKDGNNEAGTSGQFLKSTGTATDWVNIAPSDLSQSGASSGQVIKWNGSAWAPANDAVTTYTAGTGIDVTGTVITNTGDLSNTNELQTFSNSSTSTTHTTQLSNTGGSTQFVEGVGIGLATTGTVLDGIVTITNTSPEATNVGAFQTTGTANGLSLSGSDIRLHSASLTTPGAVDLTSGQSLGSGQKVLTENLNGETQPLVIRNTSAAGADAGPGLDFQGGASNAVLMRVQSNLVGATSANGAQTYLLNRNASNGLSTVATMYPFATMEATSYFAKKRFDIAANYNASSSYNNRYGHYVMTAAAITLTLPIGTTVVDGTEVTVSNVTTSGADGTVNTGAAYSEFLFDYDLDAGTVGNQFTAVSLAVPNGKTYMLTHVTVSGTSYWKVSLLSSVAASSYTIGSYNTSGTANAASITGTAISIHSASGTTPGAVDLTDNQILGDNTKIFQKSSNAAITTPVVLRNPTADSDDDGVRLTMQNGASNTETFRIDNYVVGGTISGGVQTDFYNRSASNTMLNPLTFSSTNVAVIQGYQGGSVQTVGTSFDASASLANRKANYQFETAGGSLTLPITNVAEGTIVYLNNVLTSGADGTVNTGAAYTEFAFDSDQDAGTGGNQFYTATLAVPAMRAITLKAMSIEGQLRWKVISSSTSGGGGGAGSSTTTLDDAYNNFGATASKINVDAAQSQTGGLEFEHSGANDFTVDLQGTGDFNVQDAGTPVFRVFDNGRASFGNIAPNTSQRLVVAEDGASSVGTPIRADNGATVVDNGGTQIALAYNGFDRLNLKAYNPSGSYLNAASIETTSGANITFTDDIRETRFNAAIAREITTVTATSHQCDGRTSFIRVPSSATTTTITLPEIVSGAAGSNQVNVGYELYFSINRSVAVTINRAGTSDVFLIDSQSNSSLPTFIQTTGNLIFGKKLIASGLDEWTVVQ